VDEVDKEEDKADGKQTAPCPSGAAVASSDTLAALEVRRGWGGMLADPWAPLQAVLVYEQVHYILKCPCSFSLLNAHQPLVTARNVYAAYGCSWVCSCQDQ
jgi:hypothetical protein